MNDDLTRLRALDRAALIKRWHAAFGHPAPRYAHVEILRAALAWEVQASTHGKADVTRRKIVHALGVKSRSIPLAPGTELLREWNGRTYCVKVAARGFDYDGQSYRSLTAIARVITGTPRSGPLFFGPRQ